METYKDTKQFTVSFPRKLKLVDNISEIIERYGDIAIISEGKGHVTFVGNRLSDYSPLIDEITSETKTIVYARWMMTDYTMVIGLRKWTSGDITARGEDLKMAHRFG